MNTYIYAISFAIPIFIILISIEWIISIQRGIIINNSADMISSLSSGLTNILKDGLKISVALVSYDWLVSKIKIVEFDSIFFSIFIAFLVKDFAGYWIHRMNHRVNILWNRHIIHHSSEEFNLSCALRQSISGIVSFGAIFLIPAAFLGIPTWLFAIMGPIHLFLQFWYHTKLIDRIGFLEHILVTPSHHRVHHAINPEYIDKNYSQIFIIWDKFFGTFQKELKDVPPIYGIIRPAETWNPIIINFKHFASLLRDAIYTKYWTDKLKLWFMPTGYRPKDISIINPIKTFTYTGKLKKYKTNNSRLQIGLSYFQLAFTLTMIFHLFKLQNEFDTYHIYLYAGMIFTNIFSYTSHLDNSKIIYLSEFIKLTLIGIILWKLNFIWFNLNVIETILFIIVQFITIVIYSFTLKKIE
ncbi:MAG: sterol desaturase [Candidatus Marinimicrobia bacterium]|nr:sterol desaturase [Candidatus Neomarinimicrobiota bacterium]|tara:strand:+ start:2572 stop:3807 length:1236 start_codon:yes stop_codon:yes gene_type:complete